MRNTSSAETRHRPETDDWAPRPDFNLVEYFMNASFWPADRFHGELTGVRFCYAVTRVTEALKTEGVYVLAEMDAQATMKATRAIKVRPYRILGSYNTELAHRALNAEPGIGLLRPCQREPRMNPMRTFDRARARY